MILLADESVDCGIIEALRKAEFVVFSVREDHSGVSDTEVLKIAFSTQRVLMTEAKDFGELAFRLRLEHNGILLIRLSDLKMTNRISFVVDIVFSFQDKLQKNFSVLTKNGIRIKSALILPQSLVYITYNVYWQN